MSRLWLGLVTLFWVVMNVLLWRSEYGASATLGSSLPVSVVWQKIIQTPDASGLEIRHEGEKIGYCRWSVIQESPVDPELEVVDSVAQDELDGMIEEILGYNIQIDGNLSPDGEATNYLRFGLNTQLGADGVTWTNASFRVGLKGNWLQLAAVAGSDDVSLTHTLEGNQTKFNLAWEDLRNPMRLLSSMGLDFPLGGLAALPALGDLPGMPDEGVSLGVEWEAGSEFVTVAHTRVRVYFLRAKLVDDLEIRFMISRAGEILRADLPQGITLINESFADL